MHVICTLFRQMKFIKLYRQTNTTRHNRYNMFKSKVNAIAIHICKLMCLNVGAMPSALNRAMTKPFIVNRQKVKLLLCIFNLSRRHGIVFQNKRAHLNWHWIRFWYQQGLGNAALSYLLYYTFISYYIYCISLRRHYSISTEICCLNFWIWHKVSL